MKPNSMTIRRECPEGDVYCTIVDDELGKDDPPTILISVGKAGTRINAQGDTMARILGQAARQGASIEKLVDLIEGIAHVDSNGPEEASSLPDAVAQCLRTFDETDSQRQLEGTSTERDG